MAQPTQPAPPPAGPRYVVGAWPVSRLFLLIAAICLLIAALGAAGVVNAPWLPWTLGGASAWLLAGAVP